MQVAHPITSRLCVMAIAFNVHPPNVGYLFSGWPNRSSTYDKNQFLLHKYIKMWMSFDYLQFSFSPVCRFSPHIPLTVQHFLVRRSNIHFLLRCAISVMRHPFVHQNQIYFPAIFSSYCVSHWLIFHLRLRYIHFGSKLKETFMWQTLPTPKTNQHKTQYIVLQIILSHIVFGIRLW